MEIIMNNIFYVYELIDPRTNQVFCVGKGCGKRVEEYYREDPNISRHTKTRISEIRGAGQSIKHRIIKEKLTEDDALDLEEALIKKYGRIGRDVNGILTNTCVRGNKSYKGKKPYGTTHIDSGILEVIRPFCQAEGYTISGLIEKALRAYISGSILHTETKVVL